MEAPETGGPPLRPVARYNDPLLWLAKEALMPKASARHILVQTEKQASDLKRQIDQGADFTALAKQHSTCPSGKSGGSLGTFSRGEMVREFDAVVFGDLPVGKVSEPVKTQFGYHLIQVSQRMA